MNLHLTCATLVFVVCLFGKHGSQAFTQYGAWCKPIFGFLGPLCAPDHDKLECLHPHPSILGWVSLWGQAFEMRCICKTGTFATQNEGRVTDCEKHQGPAPAPVSTYNGACSSTQKCALGLTCTKGKCQCVEGFAWSPTAKYCKEVPTILVPCVPDSTPDTCYNQPIKNLACDKHRKVCDCPKNTDYIPEFGACKLKAGKVCHFVLDNNEKVAEHDLCISQHCGTDEKCDCQEGVNLGKLVWSRQYNSCIINFFGANCKENGDCLEYGLNNEGGVGLTCNTKAKPPRCECPAGRNFYQGFCVKGTALHNEKCDPTGKGTTCKTDGGTMLTCKQSGSDWKCACLIKYVSAGDKKKGGAIRLFWDSERQICDLGSNGDPCTANDECKTGLCSNNNCGSEPAGRRSGGGSLQKFHVIPITFVSIILKVVGQ